MLRGAALVSMLRLLGPASAPIVLDLVLMVTGSLQQCMVSVTVKK